MQAKTSALLATPHAINYVIDRGISLAAVERFELGYEATLTSKLRGRLLFPIKDQYGEFVCYTGRALQSDQEPKYYHPKLTVRGVQFQKSRYLYGLWESLPLAVQEGYIAIVEGNTDAIAGWECSIPTTATMGSAFTVYHAALLRRYVKAALIIRDNDKAGAILEKKIAVELEAVGIQPYAASPGEYKDLSELKKCTSYANVREILGLVH